MSKLYLEYLKRKQQNNNKYYLFKSGLFYIFIDEDAKRINKVTPLNITNLNNDIVKCGFPNNSLEKYLDIFNNLGLEVEVIEEIKKENRENNEKINNKIIKKIKNLKIDTLTPLKALNILNELKEMLNNE